MTPLQRMADAYSSCGSRVWIEIDITDEERDQLERNRACEFLETERGTLARILPGGFRVLLGESDG